MSTTDIASAVSTPSSTKPLSPSSIPDSPSRVPHKKEKYTRRLVQRYCSHRSLKVQVLIEHYFNSIYEQIIAVVPITLQLVLTIAIFFGRGVNNPGELAGGLISAIFGLTIFVDALRIAVMPLGELLGEELPNRLPLPLVLVVAFFLGILVTYAEPAIASIRPLARLVSKHRTPYLYLLLNELQEPLIFSIGLGVGVAAVLGTLRFVKNWSLKPIIAGCLIPTVACAIYMAWGAGEDLTPLIGLSWDCGAITTGPVTVPILLALGIGVMKTSREKLKAKQVLRENVNTSSGQQPSLDGFGIVTLASLLPVLFVEILSIISTFLYTREDIINFADVSEIESVSDRTPIREIIFAVRAILPLNLALILLVIIVLRSPLPKLTVFVPSDLLKEEALDDNLPVNTPSRDNLTIFPDGLSPVTETPIIENKEKSPPIVIVPGNEDTSILDIDASINNASEDLTKSQPTSCFGRWSQKYFPHGVGALLIGVLLAQIGMILFNIGLTYGFTSIGDEFGQVLPASFLPVSSVSNSPIYNFEGGIALTVFSVFLLGFLATRAEPALNVLGQTVEKLSQGSFSRSLLIYAVCVGVASGMAIGATKILFEVPVIYFILVKYGIAALLTIQASDAFTAIAYDSAGVTTGPVTVPFVLSVGIGFCKASNSSEGFGILTCASVAPIITVLLADWGRRAFTKVNISQSLQAFGMGSRRSTVSVAPLSTQSTDETMDADTVKNTRLNSQSFVSDTT